MKLHNIAHTDHIWITKPNIVNGTIPSHMWKFLILFIPLSTWIRREAIDCVSTTSWGLICPLLPKKGGIFRETRRERRSSTVNPLTAMTESPLWNGKLTISLSKIWPVSSWLIKVPGGSTPLYRLHRYVQNFKNIKLTHEMVIRLTVVWEISYRWLKCSSLNPCPNLQRVKKILPLGLIVLVFFAWGHLHHTSDY